MNLLKPRPGLYYNRQHPSLRGSLLSMYMLYPGDTKDYSGNKSAGTISLEDGAVPVFSPYGPAITFDGSGAYVDLGDRIIGGRTELSIEVWVRRLGTGDYLIATNGQAWAQSAFYININASGVPEVFLKSTGGYDIAAGTYAFTVGQWYRIMVTWKANVRVSLYINGVLNSQGTGGELITTALIAGNGNLTLGGWPPSPTDEPLYGDIALFNIYDRKFTALEVMARETNPWAAWNVDDQALLTAASPAGSSFSPWLASNNNIIIG